MYNSANLTIAIVASRDTYRDDQIEDSEGSPSADIFSMILRGNIGLNE